MVLFLTRPYKSHTVSVVINNPKALDNNEKEGGGEVMGREKDDNKRHHTK